MSLVLFKYCYSALWWCWQRPTDSPQSSHQWFSRQDIETRNILLLLTSQGKQLPSSYMVMVPGTCSCLYLNLLVDTKPRKVIGEEGHGKCFCHLPSCTGPFLKAKQFRSPTRDYLNVIVLCCSSCYEWAPGTRVSWEFILWLKTFKENDLSTEVFFFVGAGNNYCYLSYPDRGTGVDSNSFAIVGLELFL